MNGPILPTTPIIAVASGKGGVGKTSLSVNLATALAQQKLNVLVFDGDFGLANLDVQLGLAPARDLSDVMNGKATLEEIIIKSERGFSLIPGRSGASNLPFMNTLEQKGILNQLKHLSGAFDLVLIDVAAGLDEQVLGLCAYADRTLLVTAPDPSAITDAYALLKLLKMRHHYAACELVINQAGSQTEAQRTAEKLQTAARTFLGLELPHLASVPYDREFSTAVKMQTIALQAFPNAKASTALSQLATNLREQLQQQERAVS